MFGHAYETHKVSASTASAARTGEAIGVAGLIDSHHVQGQIPLR